MDEREGRLWAVQTFGTYGPAVRERVATLVAETHVALQDAQEVSGVRAQAVYGQFWRGIHERFEELGQFQNSFMQRPGNANYKLPVVNGVAMFPWRYARDRNAVLTETVFTTSDARLAATRLRVDVQTSLDVGFPDPGLTGEERELAAVVAAAPRSPAVNGGRLVVVAIASSMHSLDVVEWGEVELTETGYIRWKGPHESLLQVVPTKPVAVDGGKNFFGGNAPRRLPAQSDDDAETPRAHE